MIDIVDPRTGEIIDTDCIPGLAQLAELHDAQLHELDAALQRLQDHTRPGVTAVAWQLLDARAAETVWRRLADWVGWLRGRYPLARQVPACWWRHPELVEELTALWLAWQEAYTESSVPATACMDWHDRWLPGLLRRIGAGGWNLACEGRHKDRLASLYDNRPVDDDTAFAAHVADDIVRRRAQTTPQPVIEENMAHRISDADMQALLREGTAEPVSSLGEQLVSHAGTYWARDGADWFKVTDPEMLEFIDDAQRRLDLADQAIADTQHDQGEL
jgi:hypothetical protein